MTHSSQMTKEPRANVSLTGQNAKRLRELHAIIKNSPMTINVSLADVVALALIHFETKIKE